jgi:transcriptional regulator with XRE-family HTH domain
MKSIRKAIKDRGFTLEQVAAQMENKNGGKGISQPALTQMLSGNPSISRVMEIARILDVTVSELVGDAPARFGETAATVITCPHCHKDIVLSVDECNCQDEENDAPGL